MQMRKFIQNVTIIVLGVAIIIMSVGYATYATPVNVTGTTNIEKASWDVHFNNVQKLVSSTVDDAQITGPTLSEGATSITFGVNLKLNEIYDFTVDVTNAGSMHAALSTFTLTGTKGNETVLNASSGLKYNSDYLIYTVTYADGTELKEGDTLGAGETKALKVSVRYIEPENLDNLPKEAESYVFTLNLNYMQAK